jgi:hypothetical protein
MIIPCRWTGHTKGRASRGGHRKPQRSLGKAGMGILKKEVYTPACRVAPLHAAVTRTNPFLNNFADGMIYSVMGMPTVSNPSKYPFHARTIFARTNFVKAAEIALDSRIRLFNIAPAP